MHEERRVGALRMCGALGIVSLLSYCCAVIFSPQAYPGYDWMSQAVSDLSAVSAPSRELWNRLACLHEPCAIVSVMAACVYVSERKTGDRLFRVGIYLFAIMEWLSAVGYSLFPLADAGKELDGFSEFMHVYVVTAGVVITSIASLVCIIISGMRGKGPKALSVWAAIALALMFAGAIGTAIVPKDYFGIVERFSLLSAVGFNAILGISLLKGELGEVAASTT